MLGNTSKITILLLLFFILSQITKASDNQEVEGDFGQMSIQIVPSHLRINADGGLVWDDMGKSADFYRIYGSNIANDSNPHFLAEAISDEQNPYQYFNFQDLGDDIKEDFNGYKYYWVTGVLKREDWEHETGRSEPIDSGGSSITLRLSDDNPLLTWDKEEGVVKYLIYYSDDENANMEDLEPLDEIDCEEGMDVMCTYDISYQYYRTRYFSSAYFWIVPITSSGKGLKSNLIEVKGLLVFWD